MLKKPAILFCCSLLAGSLQLSAADEQKSVTVQESALAPMSDPVKESTHLSPTHFKPFTGVVSGSKVRMRTHPSLEAHVVRETLNGEMFAVLGEMGDYYAILPPKGVKGYVFRTFILDGNVEGEHVNVRLSPDTEAPVVAQLNRGDRVETAVSTINSKWLELELPENSRFFIAKEYLENIGGIDLVASFEKKKMEAIHHLSAASLFAQAEIQKPFEQVDFDRIQSTFEKITKEYQELPIIVEQAKSTLVLIQDIYVQKKIAFLEGKSSPKAHLIDTHQLDKLAKLTTENMPLSEELYICDIAAATSNTIGLASTLSGEQATDKMLAWQPLEESIYHMWVASNGEKSIDEFYSEENQAADTLSGIIEPYNKPVKNRPGDFLLKRDNLPPAYLYSTRINLEKLVGQKVTLIAAPRPNHHFAFPAYFVLNIE